MLNGLPNSNVPDLINASATATTTGIVTIPGGRWFTADIQLSAAVAGVAATCTPVVTWHVPGGTSGASPVNGATLARVSATSLLATSSANSNTTEVFVYGGDNGCTIDFTAGASGSSSVTINGYLL